MYIVVTFETPCIFLGPRCGCFLGGSAGKRQTRIFQSSISRGREKTIHFRNRRGSGPHACIKGGITAHPEAEPVNVRLIWREKYDITGEKSARDESIERNRTPITGCP